MNDTEIIDLYFQRNQEAVTQTHQKYGAYLNQLSYNILRCREDTEEIVQDTYLKTWSAIPPERPNSLKYYLSRICRNLSFDRIRYASAQKRSYETEELLSEFSELIPDEKGSAEDALEAKILGESINHFLASLDRLDAAIFLSRYFYAKSIKDIASKYKLPERKVKYRLLLMRQNLQSQLVKEGAMI